MVDEDKTVVVPGSGRGSAKFSHPLDVTYADQNGARHIQRFVTTFRIGRAEGCEVQITDEYVSREHAELYFDGERWWLCDLGSRNGTFFNGERVERAALNSGGSLQLGKGGPDLRLDVARKPTPAPAESDTAVTRRYLDPSFAGPMGEHTLLVRRALQRASRRYQVITGIVVVLFLGAASFATYQHFQMQRFAELAVEIFYNMKSLELQVANFEDTLRASANVEQLADLARKRQQLLELQQRYERFIEETGLSGGALGDEDQIIYHLARVFGECEINMPADFVAEVKAYIAKWKSTGRLSAAIRRLRDNDYAPTIYQELTANQLPPQFLYLALQESGFQERAVGPRTRYGFAKGMWQFIPDTGQRYGLSSGPLRELADYDPEDERFDFDKATAAAARYLRDIYRTEAQASGLLVMASYNWGENNVTTLINQLPENPRDRNFWQLLSHYDIPAETYDYVLYIFSAAVIGENPKLFGFDFENPLADAGGLAASWTPSHETDAARVQHAHGRVTVAGTARYPLTN